jgi:hypothetical protein
MKGSIALGIAAASLVVLSGCGYRSEEVADVNSITLRKAVFDVADTLEAVKEHTKNRDKVGLYVDEAQVTFNVAAKAVDTTDLKLGASSPSGFIPVSASADFGNTSEGDRGNQITITFKNAATLGKNPPSQIMAKPLKKGQKAENQAPPGGSVPVVVTSPGKAPIVIMSDRIKDPETLKQIDDALKNAPPLKQ